MLSFPEDPLLLTGIGHTHSIGLCKAHLIYCLPSAFFQVQHTFADTRELEQIIQIFQSNFSLYLLPFLNNCFVFIDYILMMLYFFQRVRTAVLPVKCYFISSQYLFKMLLLFSCPCCVTVLQFGIFSRFLSAHCLVLVFLFFFFKNEHKSYIMPNQQGTSVVSQQYPTCWKIKVSCSFHQSAFGFSSRT